MYIDKRYRVKIYIREVRWYIYITQGSGPYIRVAITTREVSAVTLIFLKALKMFFFKKAFIKVTQKIIKKSFFVNNLKLIHY